MNDKDFEFASKITNIEDMMQNLNFPNIIEIDW